MGWRFQSLKPADPYFAEWADLRRRTRLKWAVFFSSPVVAVIALALLVTLHGKSAWVAALVGVTWFAAVFVAVRRQMLWPCPRCGRPFYKSGVFE